MGNPSLVFGRCTKQPCSVLASFLAVEKISYEAVVLGGQGQSLIEAPGNAFVLAAPRENTEAIETIGRFQSPEA